MPNNIKTAWEILNELLLPDMESSFKDKNGDGYVDISLHTFNMAMQKYAEQALDLAAEKAEIEFEDPELEINDYGERTYVRNPIVDKQSILKLKEQLK